jgi:superfamily I DNA/RNA helicase
VPRDVKVDGGKCRKLVFNAVGNDSPDVQNIIKLVSLLKTQLNASPEAMAVLHDLTFDDPRTAFRAATSVLRASNNDIRTIDFDDMLYLPVLLDCPFDHMDFIFVDEAQDTNDIQLEVIDRLCKQVDGAVAAFARDFNLPTDKKATRLFFVGDSHQAIYGFRGANSDSMTKIRDRYNCIEMPLSVSFRCSQAVVAEARKALTMEL